MARSTRGDVVAMARERRQTAWRKRGRPGAPLPRAQQPRCPSRHIARMGQPWWAPLAALTAAVGAAFERLAKDMVGGMQRDFAKPPGIK